MTAWEVFDWCKGAAIRTVSFEWLAKVLARRRHWDYARRGQGWLS